MIPPFFRLAFFVALFAGARLVQAEPVIVTQARACLGPESALTAVKSIHYVGSFVTPDPLDPAKMTYVAMEMILQSPYRQRVVASSDRSIEVTGLDNFDAWHRVQDPKDPAKWRLRLLGKDKIKELRANAWENLAFYRGLEREGGEVVDQGDTTVDGIACRKLAYKHSDDLIFYRYFERATGRLVLTVNESGMSIREQGEIRVNGIHFPKAIVTTSKGADGKERTVTITFDKITVNESFADDVFAIPALQER